MMRHAHHRLSCLSEPGTEENQMETSAPLDQRYNRLRALDSLPSLSSSHLLSKDERKKYRTDDFRQRGLWPVYAALFVPRCSAEEIYAYVTGSLLRELLKKLNTHRTLSEKDFEVLKSDSLHVTITNCVLLQKHEFDRLRRNLSEKMVQDVLTPSPTTLIETSLGRSFVVELGCPVLVSDYIALEIAQDITQKKLRQLSEPFETVLRAAGLPSYAYVPKKKSTSSAGTEKGCSTSQSSLGAPSTYHCSILKLHPRVTQEVRAEICSLLADMKGGKTEHFRFLARSITVFNGRNNAFCFRFSD